MVGAILDHLMASKSAPREVALIRKAIKKFFAQPMDGVDGNPSIGSCKCGVYAFFDYDGEPIYVGQTVEALSGRVGRHLTGRRSDAVAKFVLDPFEVLEIEVWPMPDAVGLPKAEKKALVDRAEYTVFKKAIRESKFGAVLNEAEIKEHVPIALPTSYRGRIIPDELFEDRNHPDIRLARRAATVASLARLISEREVKRPLRNTLLVQCRRIEWLARTRLDDFSDPEDMVDDEDGDGDD